jgi:hypothetical protein
MSTAKQVLDNLSYLHLHQTNMESVQSPVVSQQQDTKQAPSSENSILKVDFSWKKFKLLLSREDDPEAEGVYIVACNLFKPHIVFTSTVDDAVFGTSNLHLVSINSKCEVSGQPITLQATKRFQTRYSHLSPAFSATSTPVRMTWTTNVDFKTWEFICLDDQQTPVAKLSANIWAVKKVARFEFMGPMATNEVARRELVVMGITLFYLMLYRMNNVFSLFGAVFSRPGREKKDLPIGVEKKIVESDQSI